MIYVLCKALLLRILIILLLVSNNYAFSNNTDELFNYYLTGNLISLYPAINQYIDNAKNKEEKASRVIYALSMCETYWTSQCINYVSALDKLRIELKSSPNADELKYHSLFYLARLTIYTRNNKLFKPFMERGDINLIPRYLGFIKGIDSHFIQVHYHLIDNNYREARNSTFRALSSISSLKNLSPFVLAKLLRKSIDALISIGEPILAHRIYKENANFIGKHLFIIKPEFLEWRKVESNLLLQLGDLAGSQKAEYQILEIFDGFTMGKTRGDYYIQNTYSNLGAICLLRKDKFCITHVMGKHPYLRMEGNMNINDKNLKQDWRYIMAIILKGLSQSLNNSRIDADIIDTVRTWKGKAYNSFEEQRINSYREYLFSQDNDNKNSKKHALNSANIVLAMHDKQNKIDPYGFRIINSIERSILLNALKVIKNDQVLVQKYMLQIFELLKKNISDIEARDIKLLANAENPTKKRTIHSIIRLIGKRNNKFVNDINNLVKLIDNKQGDIGAEYFFNKLNNYSKIEKNLLKLQENIELNYEKIPHIIDASELQSHLKESDAFVTTFPIGSTIHTLCISKNMIVKGESQLKTKMALLNLKLLKLALQRLDPPNSINDKQFPKASSKYLYSKLISPIQKCINKKQQIIWVPFKEITGIPISVFINPNSKSQEELRDESWLLKDFSISYSSNSHGYIASLILSNSTNKQGGYIGIGDPVLSKNSSETSRGYVKTINENTITNSIQEFQELPETALEIKNSLSLYAGVSKALLRKSANEGAFRDEFSNEYEIVSFATHGALSGEVESVNESSLILTPIDGEDSFNDGLFRSSEISDLNISANIIQLSACNTANRSIGKSKEYLDGLSVAFSKSGAPNILGSLWYVDSKSTQNIMERFNKNYKNGIELGASLQLAKLDFINNSDSIYSNPRFWAPFILQGNPHSKSNKNVKTSSINFMKEIYYGGGEILKEYETQDDYYFYGFHDLQENGRFKSYLKKFNKKLNTESWMYTDKELSINDVLVDKDNLILLGYKSEGLKSIPHLYKLFNGKKISQKRLCDKCSVINIGFKIINNQFHILYLIEGERINENKVRIELEYLVLNEDYSKKSSNRYLIGEGSSIWDFKPSNLEFNKNKLIFAISKRYIPIKNQSINKYGLISGCGIHYNSSIHEIHIDNHAKKIVSKIPGKISKVYSKNDKHFFLGTKKEECEGNEKTFLSSINDNQFKFIDKSLFDSTPSTLLIHNNYLYIIGYEVRKFGMPKTIEASDILTDFKTVQKLQETQMHEGFIIKLDNHGNLLSKQYFPTGNSVVFIAAVIDNNTIKIGGSLGYHLATFEVPLF